MRGASPDTVVRVDRERRNDVFDICVETRCLYAISEEVVLEHGEIALRSNSSAQTDRDP
jgi:hypothetical protein